MSAAESLTRDLRSVLEGGAWHGPALLELLADVDARQASARPVSGGHSIAELVAHATAWLEIPARRAAGAAWHDATVAEDWPPVPAALDEAGWASLRERLAQAGQTLVRQVAGSTDADLARPVHGADYDVRFMLSGAVSHVVYHAGQVALLKRGL